MCHCSAILKPDILCVIGHPHDHRPPEFLALKLTIQFIEFIYCNDRFAAEILEMNINRKISTAQQQHYNTRVECSPTHGISPKYKGHNTHPMNE